MKRHLFSLILSGILIVHTPLHSQIRDYWPTKEWKTKTLQEATMNTYTIGQMQQRIERNMRYIDAFLVVKDGYLVYEKYFNGYSASQNHIVCSVTKSFTSALIGVLYTQDYIGNLNDKVLGMFPEYSNVNSDPRIHQISIEHLLSFTSGLNHNDALYSASDMSKSYLSLDFLADPGTKFKYATAASQVLSAIVNKKTGMNAHEFADSTLFRKLGISFVDWNSDAQNVSWGGYNSYFLPRDMLKLGFLYLNKGSWNGDTLINPKYVAASTVAHSDGGKPHNEKYGYNWWITTNNGYDAYFAGGFGGQFIYVIPNLDLVVAITCNIDEHREDARFLINNYVVPAILNPTGIENNTTIRDLKVSKRLQNGSLEFEFTINVETAINIDIVSTSGQVVQNLVQNQRLEPGKYHRKHQIYLKSGLYILRINSGLLSTSIFIVE